MSAGEERPSRAEIAAIINMRGRHVDLAEYFRTYHEEFMRGILIAGSIGSGKSELAMQLVRAALDSNLGALVFDPSNDYQRLLSVAPDGVVIDFSEYYFNPLESPPGMPLKAWGQVFIQVFAQIFGLKDVSISILQKSWENLVESCRNTKRTPILSELLKQVMAYVPRPRSTEQSAHASVQNRIEQVLSSGFGKCLDVRNGFTPEDFETGLLVVKTRPVGIERVHELVVGLTVAKIFAYRSWKQSRGESVGNDMLVVLEEAHRVLSEGRQSDRYGQRLYLERALIECRKLGMGFLVVDQIPHQISSHVLGSCTTWVAMKLMDPRARRVIGEAMCLDHVWQETGLMELPVGAAFVRVEHMEELEDVSPLVNPPLDSISELEHFRLPALVAAPTPRENLLPDISHQTVESMMCSNQRYLKYYERNRKEDLALLDGVLPSHLRLAFRTLVERIGPREAVWEGVLSYCGLDNKRLPGRFREPQRTLDRQSQEGLRKCIGILSSKPAVSVLTLCTGQSEMTTTEIGQKTGTSRSWTNRVIRRLVEQGFLQKTSKPQHASARYMATRRGEGLLLLGQQLQKLLANDSESMLVLLPKDDTQWLLKMAKLEETFRDMTAVAGWREEKALLQTAKLVYLLQFQLEQGRTIRRKDKLDQKSVFKILSALRSGLLGGLLEKAYLLTIAEAKTRTNLSDRGLRKQLVELRQIGVIELVGKKGSRLIELKNIWRMFLTQDVMQNSDWMLLNRSLVERALQESLNALTLGSLMGELQFAIIEDVIAGCRRIETYLIPEKM
ncbi:MAG: DUF87 domain-containing protein [Candidatus Thorarchaeota archaeon]|nr:DUF87 domain-containing protein [Candidatus Thorarchaeota archaeon]